MAAKSFSEDVLNDSVAELNINEVAVSCDAKTPIQKVADLLAMSAIGSVIILEGSKPIGIFTERDLVQCVAGGKINLNKEPVYKRMTPYPKTVNSKAKLIDVITLMAQGKFRHLVVVGKTGDVGGVVSVRDIIFHIVKKYKKSSKLK